MIMLNSWCIKDFVFAFTAMPSKHLFNPKNFHEGIQDKPQQIQKKQFLQVIVLKATHLISISLILRKMDQGILVKLAVNYLIMNNYRRRR